MKPRRHHIEHGETCVIKLGDFEAALAHVSADMNDERLLSLSDEIWEVFIERAWRQMKRLGKPSRRKKRAVADEGYSEYTYRGGRR